VLLLLLLVLQVPIVGLDLDLPPGLPAPVFKGNVYQQFSSHVLLLLLLAAAGNAGAICRP
jgi:hypothetical protein